MNNCIIIVDNNQPTLFVSLNQLVDKNEQMIRAYLKQKDEYAKRKETIAKMEAERDELLRRADAIQKDLDGMSRQ